MATTLKQVLKIYFPNTIWEYDIGFRGEKGGKSSYDIYIPEINLLIECQSEYHDVEEQIKLDRNKKEYAIRKGYDFIAIDYRDFSPLKAIQLFIPNIKSVPDYVDYTKNSKINWDIEKAQYLLDKTELSQKEIAEVVGATLPSFYSAVFRKILKLSESRNINIPIIQLTIEGDFVERFNSARECYKKYGFNTPNICSCCKGNDKTYKGYIWMYEYEYETIKKEDGNIFISKEDIIKLNKNLAKGVVQLSLNGEYIKTYIIMSDIERELGILISNISACCYHKTKTSGDYVWLFEDEYNKLKNIDGNVIVDIKHKSNGKSIVTINPSLEVSEFISARELEKSINLNYKQISYQCRHKTNDTNLIIMFKEDYDNLIKYKEPTLENINTYKLNKYKIK